MGAYVESGCETKRVTGLSARHEKGVNVGWPVLCAL